MKKLPPLIELRAFEAAARHLSFKNAAAELGVTPTAVSHQIRLLERYCGRALFRRRPRPLSLTPAGSRLFPVVRDGRAELLLQDAYWPVCSPDLLAAGGRAQRPADLKRHVLIHYYWPPSDLAAPTWQRWLAAARKKWRDVPDFGEIEHLSFREELHAIEAVITGAGIGIFSDVLLAPELAAGTLVKAFDVSLPGYRSYVVHKQGHPREKTIAAFAGWLRSVR